MKTTIEAQIRVQQLFIESAQDMIAQNGPRYVYEREIKIRQQTIKFLESLLIEAQPYMEIDLPHYEEVEEHV